LIALHQGDPLTRVVALGLGHCEEDGEDQFGDAFVGRVAAQVGHVRANAGFLQQATHVERIESGAEHAVELLGDVARLLGGR
jgi:hypothetical protein